MPSWARLRATISRPRSLADQSSPFAALLDEGERPLASAGIAGADAVRAPGQKAAPRPPDGHVTASSRLRRRRARKNRRPTAPPRRRRPPAARRRRRRRSGPRATTPRKPRRARRLGQKGRQGRQPDHRPERGCGRHQQRPCVANAVATAASSTAAAIIDIHAGDTTAIGFQRIGHQPGRDPAGRSIGRRVRAGGAATGRGPGQPAGHSRRPRSSAAAASSGDAPARMPPKSPPWATP